MAQGILSAAVFVALTSCVVAGPSRLAYADDAPDTCNDVLKGDLQDRINSSTQQAQSTLQFAAATFFSETEAQAFSDYQNEASKIDFSKLGEGDQAHVDAHYGLIGGAVDFAHSYNHELSASEFHDEWSKHQAEYRQSTGQTSTTSSSSETNFISSYASTIRDPATIDAWKECMINRSPQASITALGFRDANGAPFINVFWVPGDLVGFATSIHVKFPQSDEFTIAGAGDDLELGKGSGQDFPIRFKDPHDARADHVGFSVLVNGAVKIGDNTVRSFASAGAVPRNFALDPPPPVVPPDPCRTVATSSGPGLGPRLNKKYTVQLGPPLSGFQPSFILQAANQCDVVPEVPDFSCFSGSADVPTASGNHTGSIQLDLRAPNTFGGVMGVTVSGGRVVHRFSGTCDNRGGIAGTWRYFKDGQHGPQEIPQEASFEMRLSEGN